MRRTEVRLVDLDPARVFPFQVLLAAQDTGLHVDPTAQADQVHAVSVGRPGPALGRLPSTASGALDDALRLHLVLWDQGRERPSSRDDREVARDS